MKKLLAAALVLGTLFFASQTNRNTAPPEFGQGWEPLTEAERQEMYADEPSLRQAAPHLFEQETPKELSE